MKDKMNLMEIYCFIEEFFGYKCKMYGMNSDKKEVMALLYDSFMLKCDINDRYSRFGAGIAVGNGEIMITEFLGKRCSLDNNREALAHNLTIIDEYCRMRLPDKFLESYYKAYNN